MTPDKKIETNMIELMELQDMGPEEKTNNQKNNKEDISEKHKPTLFEKLNEKKAEKDTYKPISSYEDESNKLNFLESENEIYMTTNEDNTDRSRINANGGDNLDNSNLDFTLDLNQSNTELI